MQQCPACHHRFSNEEYMCDLCGLSLEMITTRENASFTHSLLNLSSHLGFFKGKSPEAAPALEAIREEQLVRVRQ